MPDKPSSPDQAFRSLPIIHGAFLASAVMYVIVGEVNAWALEPFDGHGGDSLQDKELWLRLGLLALTGLQFALTFSVFAGDEAVDRTLRNMKQATSDAMSVAQALTTLHILRVALLELPAIFGFALFLLGGERLDLYLFPGLSAAGLLLIWPKRSQWESAFRRHALTNAAIPADPWQVTG